MSQNKERCLKQPSLWIFALKELQQHDKARLLFKYTAMHGMFSVRGLGRGCKTQKGRPVLPAVKIDRLMAIDVNGFINLRQNQIHHLSFRMREAHFDGERLK
ncbi:hypothetical protein PoB_005991400 [Plakobranchus ocellatus]|uniref:Uncharacterized protein n=1 Tax=Plakobranchus ocellatus TaxID=259542 RepID=A0AAV4CNH4_9GAST|nr:hypothetical protein PoB_005991400 [Plakobranchus ocellatus]